MIRHIRPIEDKFEELLMTFGWKMIGIALWRHSAYGQRNFTKDEIIKMIKQEMPQL